MAHGNYDCCAICDRETSYNSNTFPKEVLCCDCTKLARNTTGRAMSTGADLADWLRKAAAPDLVAQLQVKRCLYSNDVDRLVDERIGRVTPTRP